WGIGKHPSLMAYVRGLLEGIHKSYELTISRWVPIKRDEKTALIDYDDLLFYERRGREMMLVRELDDEINVKNILREIDGWRGTKNTELRLLLGAGKLRQAFDLVGLEDDRVLQFHARWQRNEQAYSEGIKSLKDRDIDNNSIIKAWLEILSNEEF
ncbi:MAG: hypothetical protein AAFN10_09400, partial [Bacteroidota bacterium]